MMNKILIGLSVLFLIGCGGDLASEKYVSESATVLSIGDCGGGDGFFAGNRTCAISVRWASGGVAYGQTWDRVMIGQKVYKECWVDDGVRSCFLNFTTSPRKMYTN